MGTVGIWGERQEKAWKRFEEQAPTGDGRKRTPPLLTEIAPKALGVAGRQLAFGLASH